jgi:hypothetical protein
VSRSRLFVAASILLAIIGVVAVLVPIVMTTPRSGADVVPTNSSGPSGTPSPTPCATPAAFRSFSGIAAEMVDPTDGGEVAAAFPVAVKLSGSIPAGYQPWTMLGIEATADHVKYRGDECAASRRLWPGPRPLRERAGMLDGVAFCGSQTPTDAGLRCRLLVVLADGTASAQLSAYNRSAARREHAGLAFSELVGDIRLLTSVVLTRAGIGPDDQVGCPGPPLPASVASGSAGAFAAPKHRAPVGPAFLVTTTISRIPAGFEPWILVQVTGPAHHRSIVRGSCAAVTRVWPSSRPLVSDGARYGTIAFCGGRAAADVGMLCRVTLVLADRAAGDQFRAYGRESAALGHPGLSLEGLGGDVRRLASVTVVRSAAVTPPTTPPTTTAANGPTPTPTASPEPVCITPALPAAALDVGAKVTSPMSGATVGPIVPVTVDIPRLPEGYRPWTMIQIAGPADHATYLANGCVASTRIWPSGGPMTKSGASSFSQYAFCAGTRATDTGIQCRLTIVAADAAAISAIESYLATAESRGYPGMSHAEFRGDIKRIADVLVTRR